MCIRDRDAGSQKPQKEYFDYCFSRIPGADPSRMLLVGDSLHSDILGGNVAGTDTCWYNPKGKAGERDVYKRQETRCHRASGIRTSGRNGRAEG